MLDLLIVREKGGKREIKLLQILIFIKSTVWKVSDLILIKDLETFLTFSFLKSLFGKEADKLEHANDDDRTYYLIEKESLVNKFISIPKDKGSLNCAAFSAGIIEGILNTSNFVRKIIS